MRLVIDTNCRPSNMLGRMDNIVDSIPPAAWTEVLDRSAAEIAAGQTVPLATILDELRASAERLEARKRAGAVPPV